MDPKQIRELIELISNSNFSTFELEREGFKIKLVKEQAPGLPRPMPAPGPALEPPAPPPAQSIAAAGAPAPPEEPRAAPSPDDGLVDMNSPIIGTFYEAAGPADPPFVEVGSRVRKGQVLCIVEAMKVMNEIESEIDAEVAEIVVSNGQPVEFGEVLFRLRPLG